MCDKDRNPEVRTREGEIIDRLLKATMAAKMEENICAGEALRAWDRLPEGDDKLQLGAVIAASMGAAVAWAAEGKPAFGASRPSRAAMEKAERSTGCTPK